eukprot:1645116-Lingulodinium_polyedra.AAC.1
MAIQSGLHLACIRCAGKKHGTVYLEEHANRRINGWKIRSQKSKGYVPQVPSPSRSPTSSARRPLTL